MELIALWVGILMLYGCSKVIRWAFSKTRAWHSAIWASAKSVGSGTTWLAWYGFVWGAGVYGLYSVFGMLGPISIAMIAVIAMLVASERRA
jgi:hypothetical protein